MRLSARSVRQTRRCSLLMRFRRGVFCVSQKSLMDLAMSCSLFVSDGLTRYPLAP